MCRIKNVLLAAGFLFAGFAAMAQRDVEEGGYFLDRVYLGGNLGAQFGTVTFIDVSPLAGYMITQNFSAGVGVTYQYLKYKGYDQSFSTYGWRVFARHNIGRQFFAHTEFENINREAYPSRGLETSRFWVPGFFVGGGLFQPIGRRGGFMVSALYNFLYDEQKSLYGSPWVFRVGFTF